MSLLLFFSYTLLPLLALLFTVKFLSQRKKLRNLPPGPRPLPIIGNLRLIETPLHRTFHRFSQKYGDIFSLWFASRLAVIISSPSAFQECFTTHDIALANRLPSLAGKHIFYDNSIVGSCSYTQHWRNQRRIIATDVLSTHRVHSFSAIRADEVCRLIHRLARNSRDEFARVEISSLFHDLTYNNIMRMISGKRFYGEEMDLKDLEEAKVFRETVAEMLLHMGLSNKVDYFPFLKWFDFQNLEKQLKTIGMRYDAILKGLIQETRLKTERENYMIDHLLKLQETQPEDYTDQVIKGLVLAMLFGGTDSSTGALEWTLSNVLNHPEVLKKARDELDTHVGQDRLLKESDIPKLTYLRKIILETLRLYPTAPVLIPHVSSEDITIGGFNIPRGTIVIINAWAMQRDPRMWSDPTSFKPERFDDEGEENKFLAFGRGRRACPGEAMAMQSLSFTMGLLIQCFDWKRVSEEKVDMTENHYITLARLTPLEAMCKARPVVNKIESY